MLSRTVSGIPATRRLLSVLAMCMASGCAAIDNDRLSVGGANLAPSIQRDGAPAALQPAAGPSITSVDRAEWQPVSAVIPVDQTAHRALYTRLQPRYARATARQRGEYPTPESAFDLGGDAGQQAWEALAGPARAGVDVALLLPRMAITAGDTASGTPASPDSAYQRRPSDSPTSADAATTTPQAEANPVPNAAEG